MVYTSTVSVGTGLPLGMLIKKSRATNDKTVTNKQFIQGCMELQESTLSEKEEGHKVVKTCLSTKIPFNVRVIAIEKNFHQVNLGLYRKNMSKYCCTAHSSITCDFLFFQIVFTYPLPIRPITITLIIEQYFIEGTGFHRSCFASILDSKYIK